MMKPISVPISGAVALALMLNACATDGADGGGSAPPRTEVQKAIGGCIAAVAAGTILGAIVGNNTGRGNAGRGAAFGAAAGGAACAVMLAVANERDKTRIAQLQLLAAQSGRAQDEQYIGDDGKARRIQVSLRDAPPILGKPVTTGAGGQATVAATPTLCRYADTTVTVQGSGRTTLHQLVCRTPDGDWAPHSAVV